MNKAVLISIRPEWCEKIISGKKTREVRKTKPKLKTPFKCYIYCTHSAKNRLWIGPLYSYTDDHSHNAHDMDGSGNVIGEFVCDCISPVAYTSDGLADVVDCRTACMRPSDFLSYGGGKPLYGWCISDLIIYDAPLNLNSFHRVCQNDLYCEECAMYAEHTSCCGNKALHLNSAPQSWCYVEESNSLAQLFDL